VLTRGGYMSSIALATVYSRFSADARLQRTVSFRQLHTWPHCYSHKHLLLILVRANLEVTRLVAGDNMVIRMGLIYKGEILFRCRELKRISPLGRVVDNGNLEEPDSAK
jgi:hypothetical protein